MHSRIHNIINWFEIPTTNLDRAVKFYESMLGVTLRRETFGGKPQAIFPAAKEGVGGALIQEERRKPVSDGALVYLNAVNDLDGCVDRALRAGGRVVLPRTDIGDPGFIAIVADSEGNTVGLHVER